MIYLAALQDIPQRAGRGGRSSTARTGWQVVLARHAARSSRPVTVFIAVWQTITALQLFDLVYTTTRGGPLGSTQTIVYYL